MATVVRTIPGAGDYDGEGDEGAVDHAATTPLMEITAIRPAVRPAVQPDAKPDAKRAAPATTPLASESAATPAATPIQPSTSQPSRPSQMRRVRLSGDHLKARAAALCIERRLASQHAPRWYERLALWALTLPLRLRPAWWTPSALTAQQMGAHPAWGERLLRERARERAVSVQAARRIWRQNARAGWGMDDALWRMQVSELLAAAGVRVEIERDAEKLRQGAPLYTSVPATPESGALTNPTLDAVLTGQLAHARDGATWPVIAAQTAQTARRPNRPSKPIAQPPAPAVAAFFTNWYQPLRSLDVTPPPLPRIHRAHDETDTYDPWD